MISVATMAARKAGEVLLGYFGRASLNVQVKVGADLVSDADRSSEESLLQSLSEEFPDHGFLLEEAGPVERQSEYRWIIDPLDGTANFVHRFPWFCISIALEWRGEITLGVIYDPLRNEMFTAERGEGARLNGVELRVSRTEAMEQAFLATGFPFRNRHELDRYMDLFKQVFSASAGVRRAGSAALDLAYTACGRLDGYWELGLSPWDVAAGALLVEEAGGVASDFHGGRGHVGDGDVIVANGPALHGRLLELVKQAYPDTRPRRS